MTSSAPSRNSSRLGLLAILLFVMALSGLARLAFQTRVQNPDGPGWITEDPDSLYHMRRVEQVLDDGLPVQGSDPFLNYPAGSAIPWPPTYTLVVSALLAPFAPEDPAGRERWIEEGTASLPFAWGVLTTLLVALAAAVLAGRAAALVAGTLHALSYAPITYSALGNGDHHAFVSLLMAAMLFVVSLALARDALAVARRAGWYGALAGLLAGALVTTWVAALTYVLVVDITLAWLLVVRTRRPMPGLAAFGLAFHGAALLVIVPCALASPWTRLTPFDLIDLTWMHAAALALGALVFVPLVWLRADGWISRHYLLLVAVTLVAAGALLVATDSVVVAGIREAAAVVDRTNTFYTNITESRPLIGAGVPLEQHLLYLGFTALLMPIAAVALFHAALRRGVLALLPWAIALTLLFVFALSQLRFTDEYSVPIAVALGWGASRLLALDGKGIPSRAARSLRALPRVALVLVGIGVAAFVQGASTIALLDRLATHSFAPVPPDDLQRGTLESLRWLRTSTPQPPDYSVLAAWGSGHAIEWRAQRPTVATNFGPFVGEDSYRAPSQFLFATDAAQAEALLDARRARFVQLTSQFKFKVPSFARALGEDEARFVRRQPNGVVTVLPAWLGTIGARLLHEVAPFPVPAGAHPEPVDFLRVVHVSPVTIGGLPHGWVFEHVAGARLVAHAAPDTRFSVVVDMAFPAAGTALSYHASAVAGADGVARLRVPYATDADQGDGNPRGPLRWTLGTTSGTLDVTEEDVRSGQTLEVPAGAQ